MVMTDRLSLNRGPNCHCCHRQHVRVRRRVGTPTDSDYAVVVCPACDTAAPAADEKDASASDE